MIKLFEIIYKGKNGVNLAVLSGDDAEQVIDDNQGFLFGACRAEKIIFIKEIAL